MGQALYRKYRSKKLSEVIGQEHITTTLEHALKSGKISHAYLFTGLRGVGKTSIARILAHEINRLPYTDDSMHLDIIEIDAASNRRIDEIRDLRDKVNIAPTSATYKVYIIDEVHMLTKEAFNALLKTLEEPPKHVVFILATTEIHKLPETIISRTQHFTFKPVAIEKVATHLKLIAKNENISITDNALSLIAAHGEGSFRDSISLLDQAGGYNGKIDEGYIRSLLGIPPDESIRTLAVKLNNHDAIGAINSVEELRSQGFQPPQLAKQLGSLWRDQIITNNQASPSEFLFMQKLLDVPAALDPDRYLEIVLLEYALTPHESMTIPQPSHSEPSPSIKQTLNNSNIPIASTKEEPPKMIQAASSKINSDTVLENKPDALENTLPTPAPSFDPSIWSEILSTLKKRYNTLYSIVRMATPNFKDGLLELEFSFAFHKKQVTEAKNRQIISDIIKEITGKTVVIECSLIKNEDIRANQAAAELVTNNVLGQNEASDTDKPDISSISNIFGGAELLES